MSTSAPLGALWPLRLLNLRLARLNLLSLLVSLILEAAFCREIDMRPHWNDHLALENPHKGWYHHFPDNHVNEKWLPVENMIYKEPYTISLPQRLTPGDYTLSVKLYSNQAHRTVFLALEPSRMDAGHFYEIGPIRMLPRK
ncbi:hypothetical protein JW998_10560 [candidate division KSB1 bacterium]|nr:hypothetical protein [candidate division KSB1 bacterium]